MIAPWNEVMDGLPSPSGLTVAVSDDEPTFPEAEMGFCPDAVCGKAALLRDAPWIVQLYVYGYIVVLGLEPGCPVWQLSLGHQGNEGYDDQGKFSHQAVLRILEHSFNLPFWQVVCHRGVRSRIRLDSPDLLS